MTPTLIMSALHEGSHPWEPEENSPAWRRANGIRTPLSEVIPTDHIIYDIESFEAGSNAMGKYHWMGSKKCPTILEGKVATTHPQRILLRNQMGDVPMSRCCANCIKEIFGDEKP